MKKKLAEKNIRVIYGITVKEVTDKGVMLNDGEFIPCEVPVWATGPESHDKITNISDL